MPKSPVAAGPGARTRFDPTPDLHVFYIHGFASSPRSSKAAYFAARCAAAHVPFHCPDFNEPSFETLTVSRMLDQLERAVARAGARHVALIGSSLGGLVAWLAAAQRSDGRKRSWTAERLVLLAPAIDFGRNRVRDLGDAGIRAWRETGWREFYHYGVGEPRRVRYDLYEDALRHDPWAVGVDAPGLVFQGLRDEVVSPPLVHEFAASRPNLTLHVLDDDHQLVESLPRMWAITESFLLHRPEPGGMDRRPGG